MPSEFDWALQAYFLMGKYGALLQEHRAAVSAWLGTDWEQHDYDLASFHGVELVLTTVLDRAKAHGR